MTMRLEAGATCYSASLLSSSSLNRARISGNIFHRRFLSRLTSPVSL